MPNEFIPVSNMRRVARSPRVARLFSPTSLLALTVWLASCGAGNAGDRDLAANDSVPPATEVSMASNNVVSSSQGLEGPMWRLIDYAGAEGVRTAPSNRIAIRFTDGGMSGTGGCNRIGAKYTITGAQLTIGVTTSSMRACVGDANVHERAFLALLASVNAYSLADGRLTLRSSTGDALLAFEPEVEKSIFGRAWTVQNYNNGRGAVTTVLRGSSPTMTLAEDGSVTGNAGCNTFRSTYTVSDTSLTITPAAATRKMCGEPAGIMQQESAFLAALSQVTSYHAEDNTLLLRGADGAILLLLRPTEAP